MLYNKVLDKINSKDKAAYVSIRDQTYARALVYYKNPNRFFHDLDIVHDELYGFDCRVVEIMQDKLQIHIIIIGNFGDYAHFCDVFVSSDNEIIKDISVDGVIPYEEIKALLNEYIDLSKPYVVL